MNNIPISEMPREIDRLLEENERLKDQLNEEIKEELKQSEIMVKKQQEIERLNNIIDKATFERIVILMEEARDLHNIIKEVREYKNNLLYDLERGKNFEDWEEILDPIDYILDKEKNVVCICQEKLEQLEEKE